MNTSRKKEVTFENLDKKDINSELVQLNNFFYLIQNKTSKKSFSFR